MTLGSIPPSCFCLNDSSMGGIINSYINFLWVWVWVSSSHVSEESEASTIVIMCIEIRSGVFDDDFLTTWKFQWTNSSRGMLMAILKMLGVNEWMNEGRNGLTAGISFCKDAKTSPKPRQKRKPAAMNLRIANRNPQATESSELKFSLKQTTNKSKMEEFHSRTTEFLRTQFLGRANSHQNQRWRTPRIRQPKNFNSIHLSPNSSATTHNATINEIWLNALCNHPPSLV